MSLTAMPPDLPRLNDYVEWYARETPDAEATVTRDERLSYRQLSFAVRNCASALVSCGVGPEDRVASLAAPGAGYWVSLLATTSIGAIWCGLNPRHTAEELDRVIARTEPKLVFVQSSIEGRDYGNWMAALPKDVRHVPLQDAGAHALNAFTESHGVDAQRLKTLRESVRSEDVCLIVFTSGSSGLPKGVMISHRALIGAARVQRRQWPVKPLRVLNNLPINHIGAVGDLACYTLIGGGAGIFCERFSPEQSLRLIEQECVSVLGQVPTQFELTWRSASFEIEALKSVQLLFWGGAQASTDLIRRVAEVGCPIATSYGQTETVGSVTFTHPDASLEELSLTVGAPVIPYAVRIVDEVGHDQAVGTGGEVQVRSPFLMSGYWREPAATASAFTADGWLRTGDVGMLGADRQLRLIGRTSEVFKSGGYNIYPAEIEAALLACAGVGQAAVVSVADTLYGAIGLAGVVPKAGAQLVAEDVRAELSTRLANYKIPKRILVIADLPKLAIGKVDKGTLRDILAAKRVNSP